MQTGYFATAWNDIKNSPGWVGKMFLLALINLIPIFGQIVTYGYLYGWARDAAWGVQSPLPKRIFGNEDGRLYSRGFFILVLSVVFALILGILSIIMLLPFIGAIAAIATGDTSSIGTIGIFLVIGLILAILLLVVSVAVGFFLWAGSMRISIYGRLSTGFQFKKIGKMLRRDFGGILRIFGMVLLLSIVIAIIAEIVMTLIGVIFGVSAVGLYSALYSGSSPSFGTNAVFAGVAAFLMLVFYYFETVLLMWVTTMSVRAQGYWIRQFDVPNWRGQDDPMPFELHQAHAAPHSGTQYYQQAPSGAQTYGHTQYGVQPQSTQGYAGQAYYQPQTPEQMPPMENAPAQEISPTQTVSSGEAAQTPVEHMSSDDSSSIPAEETDAPSHASPDSEEGKS